MQKIPSLKNIEAKNPIEIGNYLIIKKHGFIFFQQINLDLDSYEFNSIKLRLSVNEIQLEDAWNLIGSHLISNFIFVHFKISDYEHRIRYQDSFFDVSDEEYARNRRFITGLQFTFYLPAIIPKNLMRSIADHLFQLQQILIKNNITPGIQSQSDMQMTEYISGRNDTFNGQYVAYTEDNKHLVDELNRKNVFLHSFKNEFLQRSETERITGVPLFSMFSTYQTLLDELKHDCLNHKNMKF